jgi:hypothetical protein
LPRRQDPGGGPAKRPGLKVECVLDERTYEKGHQGQ